jgi:anti-anti-sigma regulatory factor
MLELEVSHAQGRVPVTVLRLRGELDASNYRDLISLAQETCAAGARDVLLDLTDLTHMSSSGLVTLQVMAALVRGDELPDPESGWAAIRSIHHAQDAGFQAHLKLLNPQPRVDRMLDMVGFKRYLEVYTDREAAIASF